MKMNHYLSSIVVAAVLACPVRLPASQDSLPPAETVMDSYVQATGGIEAYNRIDNRVVKSTLEILGAGLKIQITSCQAKPDKAYTVIESPMTGKIENGTDGENVWDLSAMAGAQVKEGKERALFLHMSSFDRLAHWRKNFTRVETTGVDMVEGRSCHVVRATPAEAPVQMLFFDTETHLLVRTKMDTETQAGTVPMDSVLSDYRETDGLLSPRKVTVKVMGQVRVVTVDSIEQNVQLPVDRFDPPAQIRAVLEKGR